MSELASDLLINSIGADIVSGRLGPGVRLAPERELATRFETSRVTVREGLTRLQEWGLIRVRRGSGSVVRERREWSFALLPLALRTAAASAPRELEALLADMLSLRRTLVLHAISQTAGRLAAGSLDDARAALERAHAARGDSRAFVAADLEMVRAVLAAAQVWTVLWLINDLAAPYLELVGAAWPAPPVPPDYRDTHQIFFQALEAGDLDRARAVISDYLERLDGALLGKPTSSP